MGDSPIDKESKRPSERLVYVMSEQSFAESAKDEISLRELWAVVWRGKWVVITVAAVFALGSVAYAILATEWYRAEILLAPTEERSIPSLGAQLGGLAALAGVSVGGGNSTEAIAVMKSREFGRAFIRDFDLLTVFFHDDWDDQENRWLGDDPDDWPDNRDAVEFFHERVLKVDEDQKTGLVTISIDWTDPEVAANWASELVKRLNDGLRQKALNEAAANVNYLRSELAETNVVTLQQSIGRLLENELQKYMLAQGNKEFAFRVIDGAEPPKDRVRPNRPLIAVIGTILGGMLGLLGVLALNAGRSRSRNENG
ncbi:MAG: Wzz/FepE/Etk N-terminal domain-containing protein [Gammaproteobacteria bacterium]